MSRHLTSIVIPCFNEAARFEGSEALRLLDDPDVSVVLVDDGSVDGTGRILSQLELKEPDRITLVALRANRGKAEAVRAGMVRAVDVGADAVGYLDADMATPPEEMLRLVRIASERPDLDAVLGSRVALLGRRIERSHVRHWFGRAFATAASFALGIPVYDTQCGAKVFRVTPALRSAISEPFQARWAFDVELLGRLLSPAADLEPLVPDRMLEEPLKAWRDVGGSKLSGRAAFGTSLELARTLRAVRAHRHEDPSRESLREH